MEGRVLAVDPGSVRIGIAISDPLQVIATPLTVIKHVSMSKDCQTISQLCQEHDVSLVVVGQALGVDGEINPASRHAQKMADTLMTMVTQPVILWDESGSTQYAKKVKQEMGVARKKRTGHLDAHAAAVFLQYYLDSLTNWRVDEPAE